MRPPVTRWAYNNVFVRMVVVAVALLTGVAVLGGISVLPVLAQTSEPAPRLHVGPPNSIVGQGAWIDGAMVTVTVDDPDDVYDQDDLTATAGSDTIYGDSWRIEDDSLVLQAGFVVSATDGTTTRTHVVKPITVTSVDLDSGTVRGSTTLVGDDWVEVALFSDVCRRRNVDVNGEGVFVADFSVSGGELDDEATTCVLSVGSFGSVEQYDDDGDLTFIMWRVPNPSFSVEVPHQVWSNGEDWPLGIPVEVIVDDDDAFDLNDSESFLCHASTSTQSWGENPWDQGFNVNFDDPDNPCEIVPGNIVTVFSDADGVDGPEIYKDLLVVDFSITSLDAGTGILAGHAPPAAWVTVNGGTESVNVDRLVQAASDADVDPGFWAVDLATEPLDPFDGSGVLSVPLDSNTGGSAQVFDDDGDSTHRGWCHECDGGDPGDGRDPRVVVYPDEDLVGSEGDWEPGRNVTLTVDTDQNPVNGVLLSETLFNLNGEFGFGLDFDIQRGQWVVLDDGITRREHQVMNLFMDGYDDDLDTVFGSAEPGSEVIVQIGSSQGQVDSVRFVTAGPDLDGDGLGPWIADFSIEGTSEHPETPVGIFNIRPGTKIVTEQRSGGGETDVQIRVPNPSFSVEVPHQVWGSGEDWPVGVPVEVLVGGVGFDIEVPSTHRCHASATTEYWGPNPWDQGFSVNFDDPDNPCEIVPGNIVTVFADADGVDGPEIYKDLIVVDLSITEVHSESGIITGYAPPEEWVNVNGGNEFGGANRDVQASADAGYWTADLATDLQDGSGALSLPLASNTGGSAQVFDDDGDSTHRGWCHECDGGDPGGGGGPFNFFNEGDLLVSDTSGRLWAYGISDGSLNEYPLPFGGNYDIQYVDSSTLLIADHEGGAIHTLDLASGNIDSFQDDRLDHVIGIAVDVDRGFLYLADESDGVWGVEIGTTDLTLLAAGNADGIVVGPDGWVYYTQDGNRIEKLDPAAATPSPQLVADLTGYRPNGIAFDADGYLVVASMGADHSAHAAAVLRVDPSTSEYVVLYEGDVMLSPEDVAVGANGSIYISDTGWVDQFGDAPGLYRLEPSGTLVPLYQGDPLHDVVDLLVAQEPPASSVEPARVEGNVYLDGAPLADVEVFLSPNFHTCTDGLGFFEFGDVSMIGAAMNGTFIATGPAAVENAGCGNADFVDGQGIPLLVAAQGGFDLWDGYEYIELNVERAVALQTVVTEEWDGSAWVPIDDLVVRAFNLDDPNFVDEFGDDPTPGAYPYIFDGWVGQIGMSFSGALANDAPGSAEMRYPVATDVLILVEYPDGTVYGDATSSVEFTNRGDGVRVGPTVVFPSHPTITGIAGAVDPFAIDTLVELVASFVDPSEYDSHSAVFDWGDGTTTEVIVDGEGRTATGSHVYAEAGVYTVAVTVVDSEEYIDIGRYRYVVVYDPDGGFVTGGGWIESPVGAYAPDPTLTGSANFGFVSKYKKGANVPTGNTEFQFRAGDLNFHSSEYDWLVVAGAKAKFKGTGTINGEGDFGFMITATDAAKTPSTDTDLFRIKIWDKATGQVIYDNQMGDDDDADAMTAISAGNIVVHDGKKVK